MKARSGTRFSGAYLIERSKRSEVSSAKGRGRLAFRQTYVLCKRGHFYLLTQPVVTEKSHRTFARGPADSGRSSPENRETAAWLTCSIGSRSGARN